MFHNLRKMFSHQVTTSKVMSGEVGDDFIHKARERTQFTPDIVKLEQYSTQHLFVYDGMMPGHPLYEVALSEHSVNLCSAFTKEPFVMYKKVQVSGSFPIALRPHWATDDPRPIRGELLTVRSAHFLELDKWKRNGVEFTRERISLIVPYRSYEPSKNKGTIRSPEQQEIIRAWAYIGKTEFWTDQFDGGYNFKRCKLQQSTRMKTVGDHYQFTHSEYEHN